MNDIKEKKQILTEEERRLVKKLRSYHNGSYALVLDKLMAAAQLEPSIPIAWIEEQIKRIKSSDNMFAELTAMNIEILLKRW